MSHPYLNNPDPRFKNIIRKRFGMLLVIDLKFMHKREGAFWECLCDCNKISIVRGTSLLTNKTKSCGCGEHPIKHGLHQSPEYTTWENMIQRCTNPNAPNWKNYGGRGVSVCERWLSFENFYSDMGAKPAGGRAWSIDRIDNNGNYTPENCRWATKKQQCRNMRKTRLIAFNDEIRCQAEWAEILHIPVSTIRNRYRSGKPITG